MGTWKTLGVVAPVDVLLLLTDGTVMAWQTASSHYRLIRPDKHGDYAAGHTTTVSDLPDSGTERTGAVLADGTVFKPGVNSHLYDPVSRIWWSVPDPVSGNKLNLTVLADGRVLVESEIPLPPPAKVSIFDPEGAWAIAPGLTLPPVGGPRVLLPDGRVFAVNHGHAYLFDPLTLAWHTTSDGPALPQASPAVLLPDGRVLLVATDSGQIHYFTPPASSASTGNWSAGPKLPSKDSRGWSIYGATGALCLLPSGKVLCGAEYSGDGPIGHQALVLYEFDPTTHKFVTEENPDFVRHADKGYFEKPRAVTFLLLPTGQVYTSLVVDPSLQHIVAKDFLYEPADSPNLAWAPQVSSPPTTIRAGGVVELKGYGFNGRSQAVSRMPPGGEQGLDTQILTSFCTQGATNYPLLEFAHSERRSYFRTSQFSSMGVATGAAKQHLLFDVPEDVPTGAARLRVVTNGIPSSWFAVDVQAPLKKTSHPAFTELVLAVLGGGEGGLIVLTPHGLKRVPPGDPLFPEVSRLTSRIDADVQRLGTLGGYQAR
jgi:hypothetical protein